jgi:signal transduction histidine kinase
MTQELNTTHERGQGRILIVDDEKDFVLILADILKPRGYQVEIAHSAESSREKIQTFDAQVALLDMRLGHESGIDLIATLKQARPKILCVMMTAYATMNTAIEAIHQGAYDYLQKPLNMPYLFSTLDRCFEKLQLEDEKAAIERALRARNAELEEINRRLGESEARYRKLNQELEQRVTERTAELQAVNKELEAFSYSVSHDLRAPLRSINGFVQILIEDHADQLDSEGINHLQRVHIASQRMKQLIDGMLTLSRLTRGEMRRERVDLSALAQKVARELQQTQPERQVEFAITPGLVAHGDARLLRVVLDNLLGNAYKFTGKRTYAKIEFGHTETKSTPFDQAYPDQSQRAHGIPAYFVRDNGAGFDMAFADKLFDAFQRLHEAAGFEGTGIGLATVQRIVHRHGGHVWAEGKEEKGATFYFTL